jgi:NAD(P) transhydrogenase
MAYDYDLLVIGSGPGGQKAAIQAAKLGRRAAVVDRRDEISSQDVFHRTQHVVQREIDVVRAQLARNRIALLHGHARFLDPHTLCVQAASGEERRVSAARIVIAVGTRPAKPRTVAFDGHRVLSSDDVLSLDWLPSSLVVVGAGVIGIEYASMFAALGCRVTVVEQRRRLLEFCDSQIIEALQYHLRELNVIFRFDERVTAVAKHGAGAVTHLASGKLIPADAVLYSTGRQGATDGLELGNAGLAADERGRITVNDRYRTAVRHIYAVGDVIGFPSLAATSMEQGRLAACDAFGVTGQTMGKVLPIGIYTIPEISFVGRTEEELTEAAVPYEIGIARYRELARGQILGDAHGMLKLLVSATDHTLLGVHAFGTGATEFVHIGQLLMTTGGTVEVLVDTIFNYPTLAESYKVAALDAMNRLRAVERLAA